MADMLIITAAVIGALIVIFCGCVLLVTLAFYGVVRIWTRLSAFGKNMKEYYWNRRDFMEWKNDFSGWEERKRRKVDTCKRCELQKRLKKALQKAKTATESANNGAAQLEVERLKKELAMADPVVAEFRGLFGQASELVAKLLELADRAPEDKKQNLRDALADLGKQMGK